MKEMVQVKVDKSEFNDIHEKKLNLVLYQVGLIVPKDSKLQGYIFGINGKYEGRIHIKTRIGAFVAKAKSRNLFSLIAKLQSKVLRQIVNWREKRASIKRYQRRKHMLALLPSPKE
ncbi:MAG: hypothetical protein H6625_09425 [Bdellovibrionaceae bacterium]|nr:hypothetical protein [Pseudobdellovibrionaceae bacterium]